MNEPTVSDAEIDAFLQAAERWNAETDTSIYAMEPRASRFMEGVHLAASTPAGGLSTFHARADIRAIVAAGIARMKMAQDEADRAASRNVGARRAKLSPAAYRKLKAIIDEHALEMEREMERESEVDKGGSA